MEIKLLCHCGSKFKFDWDTVRDGVLSRINCPACGVDVTLEAREVIKQLSSFGSPPPPVAPPPPPMAVPPLVAVPAAPPPVQRAVPVRHREKDGQDSRTIKLVVVVVLVLVLVGGGFFAWKVGQKFMAAVDTAQEMAGMTADDSDITTDVNLMADDAVILYVKHASHLEVAQACTEYWKSTMNKNLAVMPEPEDDEWHRGDFPLWPAYNGYVRILGTLDWPESQYEGLAKFLSGRLNTLVFEERDVDFSGEFHFGVYEKGERKFHARMDIDKDLEEKVTMENEAWAREHGYKPGEGILKEFSLGDADEITKRMGMKLWDEPESDDPPPRFVLREQPAASL